MVEASGQECPLHTGKTENDMATIDIHNLQGEKVGTLDLADEIFGAVNEDLLWEAVKHYRAGQRAGFAGTAMITVPPSPIASSWRRSSSVCLPAFHACGRLADAASS